MTPSECLETTFRPAGLNDHKVHIYNTRKYKLKQAQAKTRQGRQWADHEKNLRSMVNDDTLNSLGLNFNNFGIKVAF